VQLLVIALASYDITRDVPHGGHGTNLATVLRPGPIGFNSRCPLPPSVAGVVPHVVRLGQSVLQWVVCTPYGGAPVSQWCWCCARAKHVHVRRSAYYQRGLLGQGGVLL
jgi:hypothetical protein